MCRKFFVLVSLLFLFSLLTSGLQADPIIGPATEQNGLRFESWLVSPKIAIPSKIVDYNHSAATMLFSVRVTNLTQKPVRFISFAAILRIIKPSGQAIGGGMVIDGAIKPPQEADYPLLAPGQSLVMPYVSHLWWYKNVLWLDWPSQYIDHPWNYGELAAGSYYFTISYRATSSSIPIQDDGTRKIVKTLNGFWTGNVSVTSMTFELTAAAPALPETTR